MTTWTDCVFRDHGFICEGIVELNYDETGNYFPIRVIDSISGTETNANEVEILNLTLS